MIHAALGSSTPSEVACSASIWRGCPTPRGSNQRRGYPERLAWLVLCGRFLDEFDQLVDRWSTWAINEVEQWPENLRDAEPAWDVLREMGDNSAAFVARVAARGEP